MLTFLLSTLLFGAVFGGSSIKVTVTNCTKSTDEGQINTLTVNPPSPEKTNANWTVTGTGVAEVAITEGTFKAVAKVAGIPVFTQSGDLCKPDTIKLPAGVGTIYYLGVKCPVEKGENLVVEIVNFVSSSAPDDTVKVSVTTTDTKTKQEIICVDVVAAVQKEEIQ
eukprot:541987_1